MPLTRLNPSSETVSNLEIAGGETATVYDYPFVVVLVADTSPKRFCTATIISDKWLLTAAHCMDGIRVGANSWDSDMVAVHGFPVVTEVRHVVEAVMHADHNPLTDFREWEHDIAAIRISSPFLSRTAVPVELIAPEDSIFLQSGVMTTAVGWGGDDPVSMTTAEWPLKVCPDDAAVHLCTESSTDIYAEPGDSGGPLLLLESEEWKQIGIHSSNDPQTGTHRHVRIAEHLEWITDAVGGTLEPENACVSDPATDSPSGPPPPFQPEAVEVALGGSGQNITLMTTEAGGFTLNGEAVSTGDTHAADNGNYTLTLAGGTWTATFAPGLMDVALGASGQSITLTQLEAGGYGLDGAAVESGSTFTAANGNYTLTMRNGAWIATFAPMRHIVALGRSGDTVTIVQMETGGFSLNGQPITAATTAMAANGATYGVALGADGPMVVYIPSTVTVTLGTSGGAITLTLAEDQLTYMRDGAVIASGSEYATGGVTYVLTYSNGVWSAEEKP